MIVQSVQKLFKLQTACQ